MDKRDIEIYQNRYNERLARLGYSPESLGWGGGKERQFLRFQVLSEIGVGENDSVLDVGCGFADLSEYMQMTGKKGAYKGVDINGKLLEVARQVHEGVDVAELDIMNSADLKYDWVLSSGIFNAKLSFDDNLSHIKKMVAKMYEICNKGVAVDFMSTYVDFQHPDAYHTSPADMLDFAKKELKANAVIRMDYLPYEYTVYFKK